MERMSQGQVSRILKIFVFWRTCDILTQHTVNHPRLLPTGRHTGISFLPGRVRLLFLIVWLVCCQVPSLAELSLLPWESLAGCLWSYSEVLARLMFSQSWIVNLASAWAFQG